MYKRLTIVFLLGICLASCSENTDSLDELISSTTANAIAGCDWTSSTSSMCVGDSFLFSTYDFGNLNYQWSVTGSVLSISSSNKFEATIEAIGSGSGTVSLTIYSNGNEICRMTKTLTVDDKPEEVTITGGKLLNTPCYEPLYKYQVTSSPGVTYSWSASNSSVILDPNGNVVLIDPLLFLNEGQTISFTLNLIATNLCGSTTASKMIFLRRPTASECSGDPF